MSQHKASRAHLIGADCLSFCVVQLMGNLDFPQAVEEIKQAAKWLKEQGAPKVGTLFAFALLII